MAITSFNSDQQNDKPNSKTGRRGFLKAGATMSAAFLAAPTFTASEDDVNKERPSSMSKTSLKERTLGSGKWAMKFSSLGLGCMGMSYHRSFIPEKKYMITLMRKAVDLGVNLFDTAEAYGPWTNEVLVGEALQPIRKNIQICTKFGFNIQNNQLSGLNSKPEQIKKVVEASLKSLRTDYIDLLYQHRVDPNVPIEEVAGTVQQLIKEGKVKHFGLSEAGADNIRKAHSVQPITALQSEYSLMTREPEKDVIQVCEELGIGFVPYSPLSRAFLSGYINQNTKYNPQNDNRPTLPRYQPDAIKANWVMIDTLATFGNQRGLTPAQVALSWLLGQKPFIVPIPGTTKHGHLQENLAAIDFEFTADEFMQLTEDLSSIKIVGDRYTGAQAEQTKR
ncbi:MAG: aldo/keto reductase [Chryseolinea sp.]